MFILLYLMWYDMLSKHFSHSQFNCVDRGKIPQELSRFYFISLFYTSHQISSNSFVNCSALSSLDALVTAFVAYEIKTRHWISTRGIYDGKMSKIIEAAKQEFFFDFFITTKPPHTFSLRRVTSNLALLQFPWVMQKTLEHAKMIFIVPVN